MLLLQAVWKTSRPISSPMLIPNWPRRENASVDAADGPGCR